MPSKSPNPNWRSELTDMLGANQKDGRPDNRTISERADPLPPASVIVETAKAAMGQPEVWSMFERLPELESIDSDHRMTSDEIELCNKFTSWFWMKKNYQYNSIPRSYVPSLLRQYALGNLSPASDDEAIRWLKTYPFLA